MLGIRDEIGFSTGLEGKSNKKLTIFQILYTELQKLFEAGESARGSTTIGGRVGYCVQGEEHFKKGKNKKS